MDLNTPAVQKILQSKSFAHLATNGSHGEPQSSPMWFLWDGEYIKFTHTTGRTKYQNIKRDPRVSISITDADDPYTYAEFRGVVEKIEDDPNGAFFNTLAEHYGTPIRYIGDPRVILYVKIQRITGQNLAGHYAYTQVLLVKPDLNLYKEAQNIKSLQGQQVLPVQDVKTGEARIFVFRTAAPLSTETVQDILQISGVWHIYANLDGKQRQPDMLL